MILVEFLSWSAIKSQDWNSILKNIQALKKDCGEVCDTSEKKRNLHLVQFLLNHLLYNT